MRLAIIRHGESEADILNVHEGRADFALTERGQRQAKAMAEYVRKHYAVSAIFSSTLLRARQTAEKLSAATGIAVICDEKLMEFNNGLLAGLPYEEAARKYPPVADLPIDRAVYGQESKLEFRNRAEDVLKRLRALPETEGLTVLVTHGGMINQLYHAVLALPVLTNVFFSTGDTGIHLWEVSAGGVRILNSTMCGHADGI